MLADGPQRKLRSGGLRVPSILVAIVLSASACGGNGAAVDPGYVGTWGLTEGRGPEGEVSLVDGYPITLIVSEGEVGGRSGCNGYGGQAEIDGSSFRLTEGLEMTAIGCDPPVMEAEGAYVAALSAADTIRRVDDTLVLTGPDTELRFVLVPPPPIAELTDTVWHLRSLIDGSGPDGVASSAEPAELVIGSDGSVSGTTGCRDLHGTWVESGDQILFAEFGAEGDCPASLQDQDGHVVTVLGDGFIAEIDGQTLTLTSQGGLGLQYSAEP
jgi:heat shock protein HslJ